MKKALAILLVMILAIYVVPMAIAATVASGTVENITWKLDNDGTLTISAEHNETNEEKDAKGRVLRQERYSGTCTRSFYVGDAIKDTDVKASFDNGILKIEIPTEQKKEEETKKFIDIL